MKPFSPSCERNQHVILDALKPLFKQTSKVFEIGSGTGQHAVFFAKNMPWLTWQPSDLAGNIPGILAWVEESKLENLYSPIEYDVDQDEVPVQLIDAIFTANTLHIASWQSVQNLLRNAAKRLNLDGYLVIYGPFNYDGQYTSASNAQFDQWLANQSAHSAIRNFEDVVRQAARHDFKLTEDKAMPANNRLLVFQR